MEWLKFSGFKYPAVVKRINYFHVFIQVIILDNKFNNILIYLSQDTWMECYILTMKTKVVKPILPMVLYS